MDVAVACVSLMRREEVWRREDSISDRIGGVRMTGNDATVRSFFTAGGRENLFSLSGGV